MTPLNDISARITFRDEGSFKSQELRETIKRSWEKGLESALEVVRADQGSYAEILAQRLTSEIAGGGPPPGVVGPSKVVSARSTS